MKEYLKRMAIKKFVKSVVVPLLPTLAIIVAVLAIIFIIMGATLGASPAAGGDTNMDNIIDINDEETIELYADFADNWNIWDTWLLKSGDGIPINDFLDSKGINTQNIQRDVWMDIDEIKKHNKNYSSYNNMNNTHALMDRDRKDYDLINNWGTIQSYISWWMYQHSDTVQEIPEGLYEDFIKEMHPKFKCRPSVRTTCVWVEEVDENGVVVGGGCECTKNTEYLLIEADTMRGHFIYEYEWHTDVDEYGCETTYEVLKETIDISPEGNRWYKIDKWLVEHLEIPDSDAPDVRLAFLNAETAFKERTDVIDWMLTGDPFITASKIPVGSIPLHIQELCREAAEKYGIPVEILMAIAQRETGGTFNPTAYNPDSGATGLMQFMHDTWEAFKV
ncbi:MAG: transglycosylase SLT domain-containing protein, partial [Clostridiaceae bacterium]|nr:transglycosylase SLT domain-containing protein [Clostridiaceae bacterium]